MRLTTFFMASKCIVLNCLYKFNKPCRTNVYKAGHVKAD